jgi:hypothetical protein
MINFSKMWLRWAVLGAGFAVLSGADCVDRIRNWSENLGDLADAIDDGEDETSDLEDILDDIGDWFD